VDGFGDNNRHFCGVSDSEGSHEQTSRNSNENSSYTDGGSSAPEATKGKSNMSSIIVSSYPTSEPVSVAEMKNYSRVFVGSDDDLILDNIIGAREWIEDQLGITLASRNYIQVEDSLPMIPFGFSGYAYSASQNAYFGYGPLTPYPPMGWQPRANPFEIIILIQPVTEVGNITYVDAFGNDATLIPYLDFSVDLSDTCRIAPLPGQRWPQGIVGIGNVRIPFVAGYQPPGALSGPTGPTLSEPQNPDYPSPTNPSPYDTPGNPPDQITTPYTAVTGLPRVFKNAIKQLAHHWYENRGTVAPGSVNYIPHSVDGIIRTYRNLSLMPIQRY
jgi:hypothetical protein